MGSAVWGLGCFQPLAAQVVPDNTLPVGERSQVTGNPNFQIDGGATRGGNLFHSFSDFSIPTGGSAFFNNAADVQNILTRVTGGSISNIDGLIRANGTANLFLLNPNRIIFGRNASLNIGGSFVATTADALGFPTGEVFSSDATQPLPSQLLTVNPNAFFFNQLMPQPITVQARFDDRVSTGTIRYVTFDTSINGSGLHVPPGQNLMLVGGAIQFNSGEPFIPPDDSSYYDGGWLISPGSNAELGAVGGIGSVGLSTTGSDWQLTIPPQVPRADVSLRNGSGIFTVGVGGSIRVIARNIDILDRSSLYMGIPGDSMLPDAQTGEMELNATNSITLSDSNLVNKLHGYGQGNLGSINLTAGDHILIDRTKLGTQVDGNAVGNAGDINITTGSLSVTGSFEKTSLLTTTAWGRGNSGNININARDTVSLGQVDPIFGLYPLLLVWIQSGIAGIGNAGDINITTGSLSLTTTRLSSFNSLGEGNAGNITINARDTVSIRGFSRLLSTATSGQGNGGRVTIHAGDSVSLDGGSYINTSVTNLYSFNSIRPRAETVVGDAGDIEITTGSLFLTNGGHMVSFTGAQGNAGSVTINARDRVSIEGDFLLETSSGNISIREYYTSGIFTQVLSDDLWHQVEGRERTAWGQGVGRGVGQGGDVNITTNSLSLTNGGAINTSTRWHGNAGRVTINARDSVHISGTAPTRPERGSGITTSAESQAVGSAGDVSITTGSLTVADQGSITTAARGQGDAGSITVSADTVGLSRGGRLVTTTSSNSRAGDITLNTPDLQLAGATSGLFTETTSAGDAGDLTIQPGSNGQTLRVNLQQGAQISASTRGSGDGGDLTITAPESISLTGDGSIIAAETGGGGTGGNLTLRTGNLSIQNGAQVSVSSSSTGSAGSLFADADRIFLNNGGRIRADTSGGGGNINLRSSLILLRNGSNISTNATGDNIPGGNIAIDTQFLIAVPKEDSNISANSRNFRGGNVSLNTQGIFGIQFRDINSPQTSDITATGATRELPGNVEIIGPDVDPTTGLVEFPTDFVDRSDAIAQGCPASEGNSFVVTGRGGLPPNPEQQLDDDAEWLDRRRLVVAQQTRHPTPDTPTAYIKKPTSHTPIIEATGWQMSPTGQVLLVAATPEPTVQHPLNQPVACPGR
ncbi:filamentous hemagglutinin N-terminal domain-containing protein [Cyanobacteria bacterium FACHB-472]|nr:filamentous hemagglutinin N-terminal domain-containing protein [Cyanobacteria bacterium FACHB-472]